mmetsp:Transcript_13609/g.27016  ORF Transcript_13609/g.27016 Transcript_13609/m.27016 type:complete len:104 (-) Transcript_13609:1955-2266(-)
MHHFSLHTFFLSLTPSLCPCVGVSVFLFLWGERSHLSSLEDPLQPQFSVSVSSFSFSGMKMKKDRHSCTLLHGSNTHTGNRTFDTQPHKHRQIDKSSTHAQRS